MMMMMMMMMVWRKLIDIDGLVLSNDWLRKDDGKQKVSVDIEAANCGKNGNVLMNVMNCGFFAFYFWGK